MLATGRSDTEAQMEQAGWRRERQGSRQTPACAAQGVKRIIELAPIGRFLTYGIGVPLMDMRDPALARGWCQSHRESSEALSASPRPYPAGRAHRPLRRATSIASARSASGAAHDLDSLEEKVARVSGDGPVVPAKHAERPQRVPSARRPVRLLEAEMHCARVGVLEQPTAIRVLLGADSLDRLIEP